MNEITIGLKATASETVLYTNIASAFALLSKGNAFSIPDTKRAVVSASAELEDYNSNHFPLYS